MIPEPAPLPLDRVKTAEVFEVVGVDLAGPLILKNDMGNVSAKAFLKTLGNFVKRFRRPAIIYSDNGTNFHGANNWMKKLDWEVILRDDGVQKMEMEWKFNPAISAWWGGWYERLIRTAKEMLKRTVGKASLNWKELEAILISIAEVMNRRPLTHISEDPNELQPLTPELFLHPLGSVSFPEEAMSEAEKLRFRYKHVTLLKQALQKRFRNEYLAHLVNRNPKKPSREPRVGELVLVGSDGRKRIDWPLAKVLELIPGRDGAVRLAKVKLENKEDTRTLQRLYPLELDSSDPYEKEVRSKGVVTRYGRKVKPVN